MNVERQEQLKEILLGAASLPAPERPACLDAACGTDAVLSAEIEDLLSRDGAAGEPEDLIAGLGAAAGRRGRADRVQEVLAAQLMFQLRPPAPRVDAVR